jgi:hypothetical protein
MLTYCAPCNGEHNMTARELRRALIAVTKGDAQFMTRHGVLTMCIDKAATFGEESDCDGSAALAV